MRSQPKLQQKTLLATKKKNCKTNITKKRSKDQVDLRKKTYLSTLVT